MPKIEVEIAGPSTDATLTWDGKQKTLTRSGNKWTAGFDAKAGEHKYKIAVKGPPGEAWKATVKGGDETGENTHKGKMGASGTGHTGTVGFVVAVALVLLLCGAARAGDATQELESPVTDGGVAFKATKGEADLTFSLERHHEGWFWLAGVEGSVDDDGTTEVYSAADNVPGGLKLKVGAGIDLVGSSEAYERDCDRVMLETCVKDAGAWAAKGGVTLAAGAAERLCAAQQAGKRKHDLAAAGVTDEKKQEELKKLLLGFWGDSEKTCEDYLPGGAEKSPSGALVRLSADVLAQLAEIEYHPADAAGMPDLAKTETFKTPLVSGGLNVAYFDANWILGFRGSFGVTAPAKLVEVCRTTTSGDFSTRDCAKAALKEPALKSTAAGTFVVAVNPLVPHWEIGDLRLGVQLTGRLTTTDLASDDLALFGGDSFSYLARVAIFVARKTEPWGLRAGVAPEWSGMTSEPDPAEEDDKFKVLLFVSADVFAL